MNQKLVRFQSEQIKSYQNLKMLEYCPICLDEVEKTHQLIYCGHKFCHTCLQTQVKYEWPKLLRCALCRRDWNLDDLILIYHQIPDWNIQEIISHRLVRQVLEYQVVRNNDQLTWEPASLVHIVDERLVREYEARLWSLIRHYLEENEDDLNQLDDL